jgi:hypothetical protein
LNSTTREQFFDWLADVPEMAYPFIENPKDPYGVGAELARGWAELRKELIEANSESAKLLPEGVELEGLEVKGDLWFHIAQPSIAHNGREAEIVGQQVGRDGRAVAGSNPYVLATISTYLVGSRLKVTVAWLKGYLWVYRYFRLLFDEIARDWPETKDTMTDELRLMEVASGNKQALFEDAASLIIAIQQAVGSLGTTDADKAIGIGLTFLDPNTYRVERQDWPGQFAYDIARKVDGRVVVRYTIPKNVLHGITVNSQFDGDTLSKEQLVILRAMHAGLINWGFTRHHLSEERAANHQIASDTQLVQDTADNGPTRTRGIIKRMFDEGYSDVQIGYKVGLGDSRVKQIRLEMGLKRRRGRKKN